MSGPLAMAFFLPNHYHRVRSPSNMLNSPCTLLLAVALTYSTATAASTTPLQIRGVANPTTRFQHANGTVDAASIAHSTRLTEAKYSRLLPAGTRETKRGGKLARRSVKLS